MTPGLKVANCDLESTTPFPIPASTETWRHQGNLSRLAFACKTRKREHPRFPPQWVYYGKDMSLSSPIYCEIIDFIAAGTTPQSVADFLPSPEAQQRLSALMEREKAGTLTPEEKAEVDHFMELEHILRMAKARARQIVSRGK